jgi:hypothetical protein
MPVNASECTTHCERASRGELAPPWPWLRLRAEGVCLRSVGEEQGFPTIQRVQALLRGGSVMVEGGRGGWKGEGGGSVEGVEGWRGVGLKTCCEAHLLWLPLPEQGQGQTLPLALY